MSLPASRHRSFASLLLHFRSSLLIFKHLLVTPHFSLKRFLMSKDFHLAILAVKRQTEALAVRSNQIIRFSIRRMSFLIGGTPSHTETQTMLAEHEYSIRNRLHLVGRRYRRKSMLMVETPGSTVHHIAQIGQRSSRENMACRFPDGQLTTTSNTPGHNQLIYHLPAPVCHHRSRKEPVQDHLPSPTCERRLMDAS